MHILPSRGRPAGLQRFFHEGKPEQPGVVVIDEDQVALYSRVDLPHGWHRLTVRPRSGYVASANAGFNAFPNEPWYGLASDDAVGRTARWDTLLAEAATPDRICWPSDLIRGHCTQPFIGGDLCRAVGWFMPPIFGHLYCDKVWGDIAEVIGGTYMPEVVLEHMHFSTGKTQADQTTAERKTRGDKEAYERLNLNSILEKLRCTKNEARAGSAATDWTAL